MCTQQRNCLRGKTAKNDDDDGNARPSLLFAVLALLYVNEFNYIIPLSAFHVDPSEGPFIDTYNPTFMQKVQPILLTRGSGTGHC